MNKELIKISENILEVFDITVMGREFFYEEQNYVCYSGIPVAGFNFAYVISGELSDVERIVSKAEIFFGEKNTKFNVVVSDSFFYLSSNNSTVADLDEFFIKRGYSITSRGPRMVLEDFKGIDSYSLPQNIKILETSRDLGSWIAPLETAFEGTPETTALYREAHVRALSSFSGMKHYTLFLDNRPISSITFTCQNSVAQIDDMGTSTDFQRKGYGAILLSHSMHEVSKNFGVQTFFLNSSEQGLALYRKVGFKDFYLLNVYSKK